MSRKIFLIIVLVIVIGGAGGLLLEHLIVTDMERIESNIEKLKESFLESDTEGVFRFVDPDYDYGGHDHKSLKEACEEFFKACQIEEIIVFKLEIEILGEELANVDLNIYVRGTRIMTEFATKSDWQLEFRKIGEDWLITKVIPVTYKRLEF